MKNSLLEILNTLSIKERRKLDGVKFFIDTDTIKIGAGGQFIQGEYFDESKDIVFYLSVIPEKDYKKVILHEIFHRFGVRHEWMSNKYK